jgi:lipopolysaccharide biosynthesis glycosyltransferase
MQQAYVSVLTSDDYLPGVLALHQSLRNVGAKAAFLLLVTPDVSPVVRQCLKECRISTREIAPVDSPYAGQVTPAFATMFTKLRAFELVEYQKVVYLDSDMLVCVNIDELFEKPGWSAVNAGGMLPENADWVDLNAGFLVIEPNLAQFGEMLRLKDVLPSKDGSDQGFLHSYFPTWPRQPHLHLPHTYNLYVGHLDRYCELFGYHLPAPGRPAAATTVRILHFWGAFKPWDYGRVDDEEALYNEAFRRWWATFRAVLEGYPAGHAGKAPHQLLMAVAAKQEKALIDFVPSA